MLHLMYLFLVSIYCGPALKLNLTERIFNIHLQNTHFINILLTE